MDFVTGIDYDSLHEAIVEAVIVFEHLGGFFHG